VFGLDEDSDGFSPCDGDCNESNNTVFPGAFDYCSDTVDQNCDGVDGSDSDGDGWAGDAECDASVRDCNDSDPALNLDDADGDGVTTCSGDCDDGDSGVYPGAAEACDGEDVDCVFDADETDDDGDGYVECAPWIGGPTLNGGDCDDTDALLNLDDGDGDGVDTCSGDCNDSDPGVSPLAEEAVCDGVDQNCDGSAELLVPTVHPSIQAGVDAAAAGDTVCVAAGTYYENVVVLWKQIHLLGLGGAAGTTIDGGGVETVLTIDGSSNTIVEGFTITNGYPNTGTGAGIHVTSDPVNLSNLVVADNLGVGIYCSGSYHSIANTLVVGNDGSGLSLANGGASTVINSIIVDNTSPVWAGGVTGNAPWTIENSVIGWNTATYHGGGLWANTGGITIRNTNFVGNSAGGAPYVGGAIFSQGPGDIPTLSYTNASGNTPDNYAIQTGHSWPDPTGADGNLAVSPSLQSTTAADPLDWNLRLAAPSALVDAGDPSILDPDGSNSDIGAYGGPYADQWDLDGDGYPAWWQPGPYDYVNYPALGWDCDDWDASVYPGNGC